MTSVMMTAVFGNQKVRRNKLLFKMIMLLSKEDRERERERNTHTHAGNKRE